MAMSALAIFALFILSVSLHELGHAFAMKKYGVQIREITLFGLGPRLFGFEAIRIFPGIPINVRLWPVGAYVMPSEAGARTMEKLSLGCRADIFAAGPKVNFLMGGVLILAAASLSFHLHVGNTEAIAGLGVGSLLCGLLLWKFPRVMGALLIPAIGIVGFIFLCVQIFSVSNVEEATSVVNGPIGIGRMTLSLIGSDSLLQEVYVILALGGFISFGLGTFNALPFPPLDGGHIMVGVIRSLIDNEEWWERNQGYIITPLSIMLLVLFLVAIGSDILQLFL